MQRLHCFCSLAAAVPVVAGFGIVFSQFTKYVVASRLVPQRVFLAAAAAGMQND